MGSDDTARLRELLAVCAEHPDDACADIALAHEARDAAPALLDRLDALEAALLGCVDLIRTACPDASYWQDELADQVDAALDGAS